eukprot:CAMPEP_0185168264 /NCGR_PEP_ID=MMETSP1139-20130426/15565_1 /TAXON_ID=298111 /ORGANISM="Pavlova sp., Strain CCMP459" /LENGTH=217 /DNA_ID=CAMNT_0027733771 /DNA_START=82 /DNA_END=735 /DNA_ORIENTATION=-
MPLIHVYHPPKDRLFLNAVSDGLHEALRETWSIPSKDRFQIFHEKAIPDLQIDREMWGVDRSDNVIVFHVFTSPRTTEMKLKFYERLPQILENKANLRPEDVFISVSSNGRDDWSFGKGAAQLLDQDVSSRSAHQAVTAPARASTSVSRAFSTSISPGARRQFASLATLGKLGKLVTACSAGAFIGATVAAAAASQAQGPATPSQRSPQATNSPSRS